MANLRYQTGRRRIPHVPSWLVAQLLVLALFVGVSPSWGDEVSLRSEFYARLAAPMTSVVEGKDFRPALETLAARAQINLWIDRRIDPTEPVSAGQIGPTMYASLSGIAATRSAVTMPIANVVLVGRPEWVDATAASLMTLESEKALGGGEVIDVQWPRAVTPVEAFAMTRPQRSAVANPPLPHDLWPAVTWSKVNRRVASTLVLAQFDRKLSKPATDSAESLPATATGSFLRRYASGNVDASFRQTIRKADPAAQIRVVGDWIEVKASIAAHRTVTDQLLSKVVVGVVDIDVRDRGLKLRIAPAGAVLMHLAAAAGRKCVIAPDAAQACQKLVSLEADQTSLRELADRVAKHAGVVVTWSDDELSVRSAN